MTRGFEKGSAKRAINNEIKEFEHINELKSEKNARKFACFIHPPRSL